MRLESAKHRVPFRDVIVREEKMEHTRARVLDMHARAVTTECSSDFGLTMRRAISKHEV